MNALTPAARATRRDFWRSRRKTKRPEPRISAMPTQTSHCGSSTKMSQPQSTARSRKTRLSFIIRSNPTFSPRSGIDRTVTAAPSRTARWHPPAAWRPARGRRSFWRQRSAPRATGATSDRACAGSVSRPPSAPASATEEHGLVQRLAAREALDRQVIERNAENTCQHGGFPARPGSARASPFRRPYHSKRRCHANCAMASHLNMG